MRHIRVARDGDNSWAKAVTLHGRPELWVGRSECDSGVDGEGRT